MADRLSLVKAPVLSYLIALLTEGGGGSEWVDLMKIIWFTFTRCAEFVASGAELIPSYCNIALLHSEETSTVRARSKIICPNTIQSLHSKSMILRRVGSFCFAM